MPKQRPNADEDGNLLPELDPTSPMAQIIYLLEYGRRRGFQIGPQVQVGDTVIMVRDLRQTTKEQPATNETDIWAEHGHRENE